MTDPRKPLYTPEELPVVATGVARSINRAAHAAVCLLLPAFVRHRFGWWSWKEVVARNVSLANAYEPRLDPQDPRQKKRQPVERLVRWGVPCPVDLAPWPVCFKKYSNSYNWDTMWDWLPPQELRAWIHVWSTHPKGQHGLDAALTGLAGVGNAGAVALLLRQGANPNAQVDGLRPSMENLWCSEDPKHRRSALPMEKVLATWSAFLDHGSPLDWTALEEGAYRPRTVAEYQSILDAGLPLPPASVINAWGAAVVTDPSCGWDSKRDSALLSFFMKHCPDLNTPERRGELLAIWVSTIRNGDDAATHEEMRQWIHLLAPDGVLPPLPAKHDPVPRQSSRADYQAPNFTSWGHVFTQAIFLESFPADLRSWLCSGDPMFQQRDADNKNVIDRIEDRVNGARSQSRDEGLNALWAWGRSVRLDTLLPTVPDPQPGGPPSRPRF